MKKRTETVLGFLKKKKVNFDKYFKKNAVIIWDLVEASKPSREHKWDQMKSIIRRPQSNKSWGLALIIKKASKRFYIASSKCPGTSESSYSYINNHILPVLLDCWKIID